MSCESCHIRGGARGKTRRSARRSARRSNPRAMRYTARRMSAHRAAHSPAFLRHHPQYFNEDLRNLHGHINKAIRDMRVWYKKQHGNIDQIEARDTAITILEKYGLNNTVVRLQLEHHQEHHPNRAADMLLYALNEYLNAEAEFNKYNSEYPGY